MGSTMRWTKTIVAAATFASLLSCAAQAQEWQMLPGITSAKLAAAGWQQSSAAGLSWPDGLQAVVSYWWMVVPNKTRVTMRCVDYFNADMKGTEGGCYQAGE